ncbi:protein LEAD-SENSITIVE 1-like isoform X1 [Macadamia integrifolia]|uniref:protein LEAD-SENSITIVE 1-like isoform X1 n=1 Tax=Macadamia integrifolia TaxID=60698 RepID=UPI001C4ED3F9|nr:protein LEAD-SENSITIVE 1-like isoform X1 [Macadamia integrifolia]
MGLFSNRIDRGSLNPGDHIYTWRKAFVYAHHGIYVGNDKVIHFTRGRGQEGGTKTVWDVFQFSSVPPQFQLCSTCSPLEESHGVVSHCLDCFLAGGNLERFEYGVSRAVFLANIRGGTCTTALSNPDDIVIHRATYLLKNGFGSYNVFKNNCEDFAIYCKTSLVVVNQEGFSQSGQATSLIGASVSAALESPLRPVTSNIYGIAAITIRCYCSQRYASDVGMRKDVEEVAVEDLSNYCAWYDFINAPTTELLHKEVPIDNPTHDLQELQKEVGGLREEVQGLRKELRELREVLWRLQQEERSRKIRFDEIEKLVASMKLICHFLLVFFVVFVAICIGQKM